jgi:hypothetical protein
MPAWPRRTTLATPRKWENPPRAAFYADRHPPVLRHRTQPGSTGLPKTRPRKHARAFARGLQKAGYATDPKYAELLVGLIDKYKLDQYDVKKPAVAPAASASASPPARTMP